MGTYNDGKASSDGVKQVNISQGNTSPIDMNALAIALAEALKGKISGGSTVYVNKDGTVDDGFKDENTMKKLAEMMTVKRGDNTSNFEDLGKSVISKKDKNADSTIDFLKDLE